MCAAWLPGHVPLLVSASVHALPPLLLTVDHHGLQVPTAGAWWACRSPKPHSKLCWRAFLAMISLHSHPSLPPLSPSSAAAAAGTPTPQRLGPKA